MSEQVRLLPHEAADADRLVREYFTEHQRSVRRRGNGLLTDAETLVHRIGEIYETALARAGRAGGGVHP